MIYGSAASLARCGSGDSRAGLNQLLGKKETAHAEAVGFDLWHLDPFNRAAGAAALTVAHRHSHLVQTRRQRQALIPNYGTLILGEYRGPRNFQLLLEAGETAAIIQGYAQNIDCCLLLSFRSFETQRFNIKLHREA